MKHAEMIEIVSNLQTYVPTKSTEVDVEISETSESCQVAVDPFHHTLFGGDVLTVARESKDIRSNSRRGNERLEGVVPVIEDWHAKLCFLEVGCVCVCVCMCRRICDTCTCVFVCVCMCMHAPHV